MYTVGLQVRITKGAYNGNIAKIISVARLGDSCTVSMTDKDGSIKTLSHMTWNEMKKK